MLPLQMRENKYPNIFRFLYCCPLISLEKHFGWKSKIYYTILRGICLLVFWENSRTSKSPFEIIWPLMVTRLVYGTISIFRPYFATAYNVRYAICSVASILKWIEVQKILVIFNTIHSSSMYLLLSTGAYVGAFIIIYRKSIDNAHFEINGLKIICLTIEKWKVVHFE